MARPAIATIDLEAVRHNYSLAQQLSGAGQALAIIKTNGYGHGAVEIARALEGQAPGFGVACIEEAVQLRDAGIQKPILLLEGFFEASELEYIAGNQLWCAVHTFEQIQALEASNLTQPISVWLKIDSGMHRLGIAPERTEEAIARLQALSGVAQITLMSHFSCADELERDETERQIQLMRNLADRHAFPVSLANSAGVLGHSAAINQWQRPGIMLYGATPFAGAHPQGDKLRPVMTLTTEVIAVRELSVGESVGYGATWTAQRASRIGTIAMGYGDGYSRHAQPGSEVVIAGVRVPIVGRVSMDMITVDLTDLPEASVGAKVELWGVQLPVNLVADRCNTIPYTLFTGITGRVKKHYIGVKNP